jgi:Zn-dependent alcohol dehydrogenase
MTTSTLAAVLRQPRGLFTFENLTLDDPRPDEVLVKMVACGICQTDAHFRDQHMPIELPGVLGHEGAGVVERIGSAVTSVKPGDHVVLSFSSCGHCIACRGGHPAYKFGFVAFSPAEGATLDASRLSPGQTLQGIIQGDDIPLSFIPKMIDFYREGVFPIEKLVRYYEPEEIDKAFTDAARGEAIKPVVRFSGQGA